MDLTEENVRKLPSDGSFFASSVRDEDSSNMTPPPGARPATILSDMTPSVRLQHAKERVYVYMYGLRQLGAEGYRVIRNDELYLTAERDVRFRDTAKHIQNINNIDYWEAKMRSLQEKFQPLKDKYYPPFTADTESEAQTEQDEIDRAQFRWARRKRNIETWLASTSQEEQPPPRMDSNTSPQNLTSPTTSTCPAKTNFPLLSQSGSEEAAVAVNSGTGAPKRKRSHEAEKEEHAHSKKRIQINRIHDIENHGSSEKPKKAQPTRKRNPPSIAGAPVPLRRSARIAALPKIKYTK
ncbi:hypothetical protein F4678DRAFT_482662 [Xylaria arbuscula]|nr:hypothetical protein F4678DRAFT_482662 [Xylaria arbuscula]